MLYSYLNLESTKTIIERRNNESKLYSYLNLESTKTSIESQGGSQGCTVT